MLPVLTEPVLTILLRETFLSLMGSPLQTKLTLTGLLGGTILWLMGLPGWAKIAPTTLKMDLLKQMEFQTGTMQGNLLSSNWNLQAAFL